MSEQARADLDAKFKRHVDQIDARMLARDLKFINNYRSSPNTQNLWLQFVINQSVKYLKAIAK